MGLNYSKTGIPRRTLRSQARAFGAKVPELPLTDGYCPTHGHVAPSCKPYRVDEAAEEIARSGGENKAAVTIKPFQNLKG